MIRIAIVTHEDESLEDTAYYLREVAVIWRELGHKVTNVRGCDERVNADIGILHVDLTVVPDEYLDYMKRFPVTLNGSVADISKRNFSANILNRDSSYDGPVIVKTNLNYGGSKEARRKRHSYLSRRFHSLLYRASWRWRNHLSSWGYPVFPSMAEVPAGVWKNSHLIVERFRPERDGDDYCLRIWSFLGDRFTNNKVWSAHPVVKSNNIHRRESLGDVPDALKEMRHKLGFDYGKFDYAIVEGQCVLYDANRTPTLGSLVNVDYKERMRLLGKGLDPFVARLNGA